MNENNAIPKTETGSSPEETTKGLQELRERRGLSVSDIFSATRISIANLTALENGDFKSLPPPIYTKNIINEYARMVGIDGKPLLDQYEKHLAATNKPVETNEVKNQWPEKNLRYWLLYGSLALVIAAGIIVMTIFYHKDKPSNATPPAPVAQSAPVTAAPPIVEQLPRANSAQADLPQPSPVSVAPPTAPADAAPGGAKITAAASPPSAKTVPPPPLVQESQFRYKLTIKAHEVTWIKIVADKKNSSEVLLQPGEQIERKSAEGFRLEIGNAGGIDVSFQQKPLGPLGKRGEVVVINLPAEEQRQITN